ncbi:MAG: VPLPA-CTERM sorting domain-containing protein [Pseudomonadota bacterium]
MATFFLIMPALGPTHAVPIELTFQLEGTNYDVITDGSFEEEALPILEAFDETFYDTLATFSYTITTNTDDFVFLRGIKPARRTALNTVENRSGFKDAPTIRTIGGEVEVVPNISDWASLSYEWSGSNFISDTAFFLNSNDGSEWSIAIDEFSDFVPTSSRSELELRSASPIPRDVSLSSVESQPLIEAFLLNISFGILFYGVTGNLPNGQYDLELIYVLDSVRVVPVPATSLLLLTGIVGFASVKRKRVNAK